MNFDIFKDDAFSLSQLTLAMNDLQFTPTLVGDLGIFSEAGMNTTSAMIEKIGQSFSLVPAGVRGVSGKPVGQDKRTLKNFSVVHLPQRGAVTADEVQGIRAFGTETTLQTVQGMVLAKLAKMRRNIDLTMEWQRVGAIKGQIIDADGSTVLVDLFTEFGVAQNTLDFVFSSDTTDVKQRCIDLQRKIEDELDGVLFTNVRVLCSKEWFDAFVAHPEVKAAYNRYLDGAFLRENQRKTGFYFADTYFQEYRGSVGGHRFIEANCAYAVPEGVPDLFITRFGPADYLETVNTVGLPYYAKQWVEDPGKQVELESQSNPLHLCTRPRAVVKLTKS
jgi:hypothetical protein